MTDGAERDRDEARQLVQAGYRKDELHGMAGTMLGLALQVRPDGPNRAWITLGNGMEIPLDVSAEVARRNLLGFCRRFGLAAQAQGRGPNQQRSADQLAFGFMAEMPPARRPPLPPAPRRV
ncbi:hypothetical protein [Falsiroseomonas sp. HW251]|uniref:hypothetical protein n=1 Tax=Falsiroseomonas sp. HW251 TaxID=3390998 RepID=UPI003D3160AF